MEGPVDRCPYARPFPDDFDDCAAYQPVQYVPFDLNHNPLTAVWSCGHLDSARAPFGGYYPQCRLGDRAARVAWVQHIALDRVESWREIAREFGNALADPLAAVYSAKQRQLEAAADPTLRIDIEDELRAAIRAFLETNFAMLDARAEELARIGFPIEPMKLVTRAALDDFVTRDSVVAGWTPPEEMMAAFPVDTRAFLVGLFQGPTAGDGRA